MRIKFIPAVAFGLAAMLAWPAAAQDLASSIVGVWKLTSQMIKEVETGATVQPLGEKPSGHWVFTRGGHFTWVIVGANRKAPAGPAATDAERSELFKTLSFGSGTYKTEGDKVASLYDTSWIQSWTGTERKAQVQIASKTLTITSAPYKNAAGKEQVAITTWERAE